MSVKATVLVLFTLIFGYKTFLRYIEKKSCANPIPDSVKDVYDAETYARWREYSAEKLRISMYAALVTFAVDFALLASNAYAWFASLWQGSVYSELFIVMLFSTLIGEVTGIPFSYIDDMVIEQKYGFNRTTLKTFIADRIKGFVLSMVLTVGLVCALAAIHMALGDWMLVLFTGVVMLLMLGISFLYPYFTKLFNKFTDLEEGELKDKLTALLTKNGYKVRGIKVMDASKRSTKSNAYFAGFGKTKTIVLYDTLLGQMNADEICAVFAHEMGHGLHRDTMKMQLMSFINVFLMVLMIWFVVSSDALAAAFGFEHINYAFSMIIALSVGFEVISPLFGLLQSWYSRRAEYMADATAVEEGYGETLISALKKLTRENFGHLAPSKLLVKLEYSHPPLAERIAAIQKRK